jgi:hypothetical protein
MAQAKALTVLFVPSSLDIISHVTVHHVPSAESSPLFEGSDIHAAVGEGFGVWGLGSEVWGLGFGVWGFEFRVSSFGLLVFGFWFLVFGFWFLVFGFWFDVWCLVFDVWCLVFGVWGFVFGVSGTHEVMKSRLCQSGTNVLIL